MAYVSKQDKAELAPAIKAVLKKYKMKGTISIEHYSILVVKVTKGAIDFTPYMMQGEWPRNYIEVNEHFMDKNYSGIALSFLNEMIAAMKGPDFYDRSDAMTDYFDRSHYLGLKIGNYLKPYELTC